MNIFSKKIGFNMSDTEWEEPTWEAGDMDPHWDELYVPNSLFLMRTLHNDMKTNNLDAMLKRLSSLNPKQLDTFLQDYHSIDEQDIDKSQEVTQHDQEESDHEDEEHEYENEDD